MTGGSNTATGESALRSNVGGGNNTASGFGALFGNTGGHNNTATGVQALNSNGGGTSNTANGFQALFNNTADFNTAIGVGALSNKTTGSRNIAVGVGAGGNLTTGSDNIYIANTGVAGDANTIRIGSGVHQATFIGGISGATVPFGSPQVFIDAVSGRLGTNASSSARFKEQIRDMGDVSSGLLKLRPVTFHYRPEIDPTGSPQYGLIAEEVEEVLPDLVAYDREGRVQGVKYQVLPTLLLNELQKQQRLIEALEARLATLESSPRPLPQHP